MPISLRKCRTCSSRTSPDSYRSVPEVGCGGDIGGVTGTATDCLCKWLAICLSEKPRFFASRNTSGLLRRPGTSSVLNRRLSWWTLWSFARNQRSIEVSVWTSSISKPNSNAFATAQIRTGVGFCSSSRTLEASNGKPRCFSSKSNRRASKPREDSSTILRAFWIVSSNVRPIDITSPTLFMHEPTVWSTVENFRRSQRGTLATT
mmetsp:Transcript_6965/g.17396  ORF Transcript_6965/g.17396 Transcript_6965/m.17396 type:complete len:205 (+) Transcript_6965:1253-1867(+)